MKNNRREFLQKLTLLAAAGSTASIPLSARTKAKNKEDGKSDAFLTAPYLQNMSETEITVSAITGIDSLCWVELIMDNNEKRHVFNKKDGFIDVGKGLVQFKIDNLSPGKTYRYRLYIKEINSFEPYDLQYGDTYHTEIFTFTTPDKDAETVSCLILNDIHDRPKSFKHLLDFNTKPYEFVFLNGDMFDYQTDENQLIEHLIQPCTDIFASEKPFILSRGNHETRGKFARDIKDYFKYPKDKYYFSFQQGPAFFIVLDTGEDKPDDTPVYADIVDFDAYREEQKRWLEEEVMNTSAYKNALYKVVFMHIPTFHSGDWHGTMHCRELFSSLFENHKIDIVISGHTHRYGVHAPNSEHRYPIIIGGGPKEGERTVIHFEADPEQLKVSMLDDNGIEVGKYEIPSQT